ncbi:MAG: hypothetical protein V4437_00290 [Patescibacteria group bacterium]
MALIVTFFAAFILLAFFLAFRTWEEKKGVRLFAHARSAVDAEVTRLYEVAVTGSIPRQYRARFFAALQAGIHRVVITLVAGLRAAERPLTRLSFRMRMASSKANKKEVSSFLKTIAPDKPIVGADDGASEKKSV